MRLVRDVIAFGLLTSYTLAQGQLGAIRFPSNALSPRYYLEASPLQKRETGCRPSFHPCNDINATACCSDDTYCLVDPTTWQPRCCAIGSQCDSPCLESQYQCNATTTITARSTTTTSIYKACCPRPCASTSQYLCPSSLGGGCCPYGAACASGGSCLSTSAASSSASAVVTEIPSGCTTSQIACPTEEGGGCCALGKQCTQVSGSNFCAPATVSPTASGVVAVEQGGDGLSAAAKGGIGAGVAVGASLLIGGLTWWCLRRRRARSQAASSAQRRSGGGRYAEGGEAGQPMTEGTSDVTSSRPERLPGLTADYFGPDAVAGPYTVASNTASSPGHLSQNRAVPTDPHHPDDIAVPIEIDSNMKGVVAAGDEGTLNSNLHTPSVIQQAPTPETVDGRFELYGSDIPSPSPPTGNASSAPSPLDSPTMGHSTLNTITSASESGRER